MKSFATLVSVATNTSCRFFRKQIPFNPANRTDKPALDDATRDFPARVTMIQVNQGHLRLNFLRRRDGSVEGAWDCRPAFPFWDLDRVTDGFAIAAASQSEGSFWEVRHCPCWKMQKSYLT